MRAFITGASSGLGRGLALHYASPGAIIGIVARRSELLSELAREIEGRGARARTFALDVSDSAAMAKGATEFVDRAGGVDLVVANAGIAIPDRIRKGDSESIANLMRVNVIGVTNTIVPFVPLMLRAHGGVLAAVSSVAGLRPMPGRAPYSASKAAVNTFMEALRLDLLGTGVHAMAICPGFVHTPMTAKLRNMPFVIEADEAVRLMAGAIERREALFTFPWQMRVMTSLMRHAPDWAIRRFAPPPRPDA
jgi:short-subunit dehydrogenase